MGLYFKYLSILFKSQLQYRTSFWLLTFGQFFIPFSVFAGLYFMFERFGQLRGWSFYETALCFAIIHMAFSLSECFARGFDAFSSLVAGGEFDRVLVRPRSTVVQVLGSKFEFTRFGRLLQSAIILVWALYNLPIEWSIAKVITLLLMVASGVLIFTGIYMLAATLCFWTIQGMEVANIFTDGGREMAQYPLNIYQKWVTVFFTFIIPFGCVSYLPLLYILDKVHGNEILYMLMPLAGVLFLLPCILVWQLGVRHYRSTGS
ncbi:ABC transporter permease [Paenibacillus prosopidis]|uniref:ABC-2 type transport system permease protein n=1 Tax=Paenibacillus prosopidis TaxID=630520 RepID=A0A368VJI9_9BACL|nr:ABC-2 family transporter protein [Paenibacillus prosopidis]RCW41772.1 ABC-2 type transport system permease protein [Paenibacillus prosopidis]